jgi:hypothetical protein
MCNRRSDIGHALVVVERGSVFRGQRDYEILRLVLDVLDERGHPISIEVSSESSTTHLIRIVHSFFSSLLSTG